MQKFLLTTALVLPLTAGFGFAQTSSTTTTTPPATTTEAPATDSAAMPATEGTAPNATAQAPNDATGSKPMDSTSGTMPASGTTTDTPPAEADAASTDATSTGATSTDASSTSTGSAAPMEATATSTTDTTTTTTTTDSMPAATTTTDTAPVDSSASTSDGAVTTTDAVVATPADVVREQAPNELRVDWITGTSVTSAAGETVGTINDIIVDGETGMMKAAVVGVGGFLGIGEKQIAIDWSKLTVDYDANAITTAVTREEAKAAPAYVFREQERAPAPVAASGTMTDTTTMPATTTDPAAAPMGTTAPADGSAAPATN